MKSKQRIKRMVLLALFGGIEVVLMLTPLGYIPVGPVRATTLHIPVILAGILLGPSAGAAIGAVFGVTSIIINTLTPTATSFVFSPFYAIGEFHGGLGSLVIALGPRILLGLTASWLYSVFLRFTRKLNLSLIFSAVISTLMHTTLVMLGIYFFFGEPYAAVKGTTLRGLIGLLMTIVATNGVLETLIGAVIVLGVGRVLIPIAGKQRPSAAGKETA